MHLLHSGWLPADSTLPRSQDLPWKLVASLYSSNNFMDLRPSVLWIQTSPEERMARTAREISSASTNNIDKMSLQALSGRAKRS